MKRRKEKKEVEEQQKSLSKGPGITKRKLQNLCHSACPCCHYWQKHRPSFKLSSCPFLIYCMFHMLTVCTSGEKFLAASKPTNLYCSPGQVLSRNNKSFLREADWNNGGDCSFLLRCSARLSTASEEERERGAFHIMSTRNRAGGNTEWIKLRETLKTNSLLTVPGKGCVWSESSATMHVCLQRHVS